MAEALSRNGGEPRATFGYLYQKMNQVASFGRTACFDYLTMIGKLGLAPIVPGTPYLKGATGPLRGASLLFGVDAGASKLNQWSTDLAADLNIDMQVVEDALCNTIPV